MKPGTDCPDGICAAWIAAKYYGYDYVELAPVVYHNDSEYTDDFVIPFDYVGRQVVMLDFAYNQLLMEKIARSTDEFIVLDHHEPRASILNNLHNFTESVLARYSPNENDCGATLAWKEFFPDMPEPWFLRHVWQRDTGANGYYDGEIPYSEKIGNAMSFLRSGAVGKDAFPIFDLLASLDHEQIGIIERVGFNCLKERDALCQQEIDYWQQNQKMVQVKDNSETGLKVKLHYLVPFLKIQNPKCDEYYSWVGTLLARKYKDIFVAIQTSTDNKGYSLRSHSSSKIHLGKLAESNGGGGHRHSAGFNIKESNEENN
jgi:single-stranded DNA-specific DHH superfamily exonuclease